MVSLAALFTPVFTMGLGSLPPHLYSHGSSLLGTIQQVAGAMGTALVVTIMTSRAASLVDDGVGPVAASLGGHALGVRAWRRPCASVVLGLVALLPARIDDPDATGPGTPVDDLDEELDAVRRSPSRSDRAGPAISSVSPLGAPAQCADQQHPQLGAGLLGDRLLAPRAGR